MRKIKIGLKKIKKRYLLKDGNEETIRVKQVAKEERREGEQERIRRRRER